MLGEGWLIMVWKSTKYVFISQTSTSNTAECLGRTDVRHTVQTVLCYRLQLRVGNEWVCLWSVEPGRLEQWAWQGGLRSHNSWGFIRGTVLVVQMLEEILDRNSTCIWQSNLTILWENSLCSMKTVAVFIVAFLFQAKLFSWNHR